MNRPKPEEYNPFYAGYIASVPDDVLRELEKQAKEFPAFIKTIGAAKADFAYAPGKWTVKELLGHLIDTERIMAYRALRFARNDDQNLPGFDENEYVEHSNYQLRTLDSLAEEFSILRKANLFMVQSFTADDLLKRGKANQFEISVRALLFIMAGHVNHHQKILKERYLNPSSERDV